MGVFAWDQPLLKLLKDCLPNGNLEVKGQDPDYNDHRLIYLEGLKSQVSYQGNLDYTRTCHLPNLQDYISLYVDLALAQINQQEHY